MSSDRERVGRAASWLFAVAALCSALELTGCGGGAPGDAVATVDGEPIEHCKNGPQRPTTERRG
jgi:hypothetical protein